MFIKTTMPKIVERCGKSHIESALHLNKSVTGPRVSASYRDGECIIKFIVGHGTQTNFRTFQRRNVEMADGYDAELVRKIAVEMVETEIDNGTIRITKYTGK